ncbi:MAG: hypothetical protein GX673_10600 [Gammaproteobacteria bacterium]|nr:hypothetical protein [Gammaproteobacteria bacterium]
MGVIKIEQDGKKYSAEYILCENVVTVFGDSGQESTQLDGMAIDSVARMLLRNLIRKGSINPVAME